jgi:hypothetical protein
LPDGRNREREGTKPREAAESAQAALEEAPRWADFDGFFAKNARIEEWLTEWKKDHALKRFPCPSFS